MSENENGYTVTSEIKRQNQGGGTGNELSPPSAEEKIDYGNSRIDVKFTNAYEQNEQCENREIEIEKKEEEELNKNSNEEETVLNNPENPREAPNEKPEEKVEEKVEEKTDDKTEAVEIKENSGGAVPEETKPEIRYEV